jgi:hypothetical protein
MPGKTVARARPATAAACTLPTAVPGGVSLQGVAFAAGSCYLIRANRHFKRPGRAR